MLRFRKLSEKYHFDGTFYMVVFGLAAVIFGVYFFGRRSYDRYTGAEVQALLTKENLGTIEAYRKQAKTWVSSRVHNKTLTADERKAAEEIVAQGLYDWTSTWTRDRMNSVSKAESDRKQKALWSKTMADLDLYLAGIGKK